AVGLGGDDYNNVNNVNANDDFNNNGWARSNSQLKRANFRILFILLLKLVFYILAYFLPQAIRIALCCISIPSM
ncbi:MAG TPA: hypothetical protein VJJ82_01855, partial [Candidatus Nanoarchaeia archaeon]|nr:hypothetical protein [Candidatus Nanoarchaeia archaeon]